MAALTQEIDRLRSQLDEEGKLRQALTTEVTSLKAAVQVEQAKAAVRFMLDPSLRSLSPPLPSLSNG